MSTIIKHKQFPKYRTWTMDLCGRPLTIEVGKTTELASAAAWVKYGDTTVHVAVTVSPRPRDGIDFFPLSVEFEEKLYAVGRIPGSFMRREGRPSLPAVLASRLIDRPMRPLFPYDFRNDVCIQCTVMSLSLIHIYSSRAMLAERLGSYCRLMTLAVPSLFRLKSITRYF